MYSSRKTHNNVVLELQGTTHHYYTVVASDLGSKEEADKLADTLARENLGTSYVPARLYKKNRGESKHPH